MQIFLRAVRTEEKKLLVNVNGIAENYVFSSQNGSFARTPKAFDWWSHVVLNSISGEGTHTP